jgi:hypothetical protein
MRGPAARKVEKRNMMKTADDIAGGTSDDTGPVLPETVVS